MFRPQSSAIFYIQPDDGRTLWLKHVVEFTSSKLIYHPVPSCVWRHIVYTLHLMQNKSWKCLYINKCDILCISVWRNLPQACRWQKVGWRSTVIFHFVLEFIRYWHYRDLSDPFSSENFPQRNTWTKEIALPAFINNWIFYNCITISNNA